MTNNTRQIYMQILLARIQALRHEGMPNKQIALAYGIPHGSISGWLYEGRLGTIKATTDAIAKLGGCKVTVDGCNIVIPAARERIDVPAWIEAERWRYSRECAERMKGKHKANKKARGKPLK